MASQSWIAVVKNVNLFQRLNVAVDVAHALEHLHHHCETSIIYCDLKPSNILLNDEMVGHVADFGLAKFLSADSSNQSSSLGLRGTVGCAPPGNHTLNINFLVTVIIIHFSSYNYNGIRVYKLNFT